MPRYLSELEFNKLIKKNEILRKGNMQLAKMYKEKNKEYNKYKAKCNKLEKEINEYKEIITNVYKAYKR